MAHSERIKAPSYRPTLIGTNAPGDSLLATLHRDAAPAKASGGAIAALDQATGAEDEQLTLFAARPRVQRDIAQFAQALALAKTPAQLLADPTALEVLLTANGLGDQRGNTMLAARALLSDPSRTAALVNQLADPRWLSVNKTYAFATKGLEIVSHPDAIAAIADSYAEALWRAHREPARSGDRDPDRADPVGEPAVRPPGLPTRPDRYATDLATNLGGTGGPPEAAAASMR